MLTKLIIFGLLCNTVIQALPDKESGKKDETLPSANSIPGEQKLPCDQQIGWIKDATLGAKKQYDDYYDKLKAYNVNVKDFKEVSTQHDKINQLINDSFKKYNSDLKKLRTLKSDAKAQWDICIDELKSFSFMNRNLSALTQSIRSKVIDFAKKLGLPHDSIDDLDHILGRIVNFMFIIDMGKNTFRDIYSMIKEAGVKTTEGIKLEEKYRFTGEGVEAIGKLEEGEIIGRVEEPTVPSKRKPNLSDKKPRYEEYMWDTPEDDKELDNLINQDEKMKTVEQELEERERIIERELIQQEEIENLEREEQERLEREERIKRERIKFNPEVFRG